MTTSLAYIPITLSASSHHLNTHLFPDFLQLLSSLLLSAFQCDLFLNILQLQSDDSHCDDSQIDDTYSDDN